MGLIVFITGNAIWEHCCLLWTRESLCLTMKTDSTSSRLAQSVGHPEVCTAATPYRQPLNFFGSPSLLSASCLKSSNKLLPDICKDDCLAMCVEVGFIRSHMATCM